MRCYAQAQIDGGNVSTKTRCGLVLGGGGPVGAAWYAGLAAGLAERGVCLQDADVVIGTSAGAVAGAWLASGEPVDRFVDAMVRNAADNAGVDYTRGVDLNMLVRIYERLGSTDAPLDTDECRAIAELAALAPSPQASPDYASYLPSGSWPTRFRAVAVEVRRGAVRLLGPEDQIALASGVAASCAAPAVVAPVGLDDGRYVDGGARSSTNADLMRAFDVERCIICTPIVGETPIVGVATGRVLDEEVRRLDGVETAVVRASDIEAEAFGFDLLNMAKVSSAIAAGRARAAREAERLARVWPRR